MKRWRGVMMILFCIATGGIELLIVRQRSMETRARLQKVQTSGTSLDRRIERARADLEELGTRVDRARTERNKTAAAYARAVARAQKADPESAWAEPPAGPEWNPESPFVWISKSALTNLQLSPFDARGEIDTRVAAALALSREQQENLNAGMQDLLGRAQQMEIQSAQVSTSSLPTGGIKITIAIPPAPDAFREYQGEFDSLLRSNLTAQQHEFMRRLARGWVSEHLASDDANPNLYSVETRENGTIEIQRRWGKGASSTVSGNLTLDHYIPRFLMPFFSGLHPAAEASSSSE